jgi:hypothetical protein
MKNVVYTAVFGGYDIPAGVDAGWNCDFVCFTDEPSLRPEGWRVELVKDLKLSPADANRKYKMLPHLYLEEYSKSLYIDGNIQINVDPSIIFAKYDNASIAAPKHRERDCAYDEARTCFELGLLEKSEYEAQTREYCERLFPKHYGLTENNILIRHHKNPLIIRLMDEWWAEYRRWGKRDQIILPYLLWKNNVGITYIAEGAKYTSDYFTINLHASEQKTNVMRRAIRIANKRYYLGLRYRVVSSLAQIVVRIVRMFAKHT